MAGKKAYQSGKISGCLSIIGLGLVIYFFTVHWILGVIGLVGFFALLIASTHHGDCDICGVKLKQRSYRKKIDGKKYVVCPTCNKKLEKEQSDEKFEEFQIKRAQERRE